MQTKNIEIGVGIFILITLCAAIFISLRVADLKSLGSEHTYRLYATFNNIGGLKVGSPVRVGGVTIGRIDAITLGSKDYLPHITMDILSRYNNIPDTSSLSVRTAGLLGEQYLALSIGFEDPELGTKILKDGDTIQDTKSALALEDLIGQMLYKSNSGNSNATPITQAK